MAYSDQQMSGNKIVAIIIVGLIHVAIGYVLITGLAYSAVKKVVERVTTVDIEEPPPPEPEEEPPPPEPQPDTAPPPPVAPPPPISVATNPPQVRTQQTIPPPAPPALQIPLLVFMLLFTLAKKMFCPFFVFLIWFIIAASSG